MNINGYVPFLIKKLDNIVRGDIFADKVITTSSGYFIHTASKYCILLMI